MTPRTISKPLGLMKLAVYNTYAPGRAVVPSINFMAVNGTRYSSIGAAWEHLVVADPVLPSKTDQDTILRHVAHYNWAASEQQIIDNIAAGPRVLTREHMAEAIAAFGGAARPYC